MKRKLIAGILAMGIAAVMAGCNGAGGAASTEPSTETTTEVSQHAFDLDAYKADVAKCGRNIYDQAMILGNMLTWEGSYIKSVTQFGGSVSDTHKTLQGACEFMQESYDRGDVTNDIFNNVNETTLKISYDEIAEEYMTIAETETDSAAADDIREQIKTMYQAYVAMYTGATEPTSSAVVSGLEAVSEISDAAKMLTTLTGGTVETGG